MPAAADSDLPAGDFAGWRAGLAAALRGEGDSDVPCAGCTACCTSAQFVHIGPEETETLAAIPPELLFPAPRMPRGHVLLGYDERGRCPMLGDRGCSIYEQRPRACRVYDCRVFAAAGVMPREAEKAGIAQRARRWRFAPGDAHGQREQEAVRRAARYLAAHAADLPADLAPPTESAVALLAIHLAELFGDPAREPAAGEVAAALRELRRS